MISVSAVAPSSAAFPKRKVEDQTLMRGLPPVTSRWRWRLLLKFYSWWIAYLLLNFVFIQLGNQYLLLSISSQRFNRWSYQSTSIISNYSHHIKLLPTYQYTFIIFRILYFVVTWRKCKRILSRHFYTFFYNIIFINSNFNSGHFFQSYTIELVIKSSNLICSVCAK